MTAEERFWQQWIRHEKEGSRAERQYKYGDPAKFVRFEQERKGALMRKIIKSSETSEDFAKKAPIDKLLDIWAEFISLRDRNEPGGYANPQDVKDFMRVGEAVEAAINDLKRHQWWAVRRSRGICTVWMFQDAIFENSLQQAKEKLEEKLKINVATARYFN